MKKFHRDTQALLRTSTLSRSKTINGELLFLALLFLFASPCLGQVNGSGIITAIAGSSSGFSGDGGNATAATINNPTSVTVDATGNVYIADNGNYRIRKINTSGIITTFAGSGTLGFSGDGGPATNANLGYIACVVARGTDVFYSDNYSSRIRKINSSGVISTVAGGGSLGDGNPATAASFTNLSGFTFDATGNVFICDQHKVRKVNTSGIVSTVAGTTFGFSGDGGPATNAQLWLPNDVAADASGNIYISDFANNRIRKVNTAGVISTFAGTGTRSSLGDGGPATAATFQMLVGLGFDASGILYTSEGIDNLNSGGNRIRKINQAGVITKLAGKATPGTPAGFSGDGSPALNARFNYPLRVAFDASGNMYVPDARNNRIRKVSNVTRTPFFAYDTTTAPNVICQNLSSFALNSILAVYDTGIGQTLTWSVLSAPSNGTASVSFATTSNADIVIPAGITYAPTTGFTGLDSFSVLVSDGIGSDTMTVRFNVVALPSAITGVSPICRSVTLPLAHSTSGGVWSSSSTGIASIGSSSGVVTGGNAGTALITYNIGTGCNATVTVTVLPSPLAITGMVAACVGTPMTLSCQPLLIGTWSSSVPSVATIGTSGSVATIGAGTTTISYTLSSGCASTYVLTVNSQPSAITGPSSLCPGTTITAGNAASGGVWSSGFGGILTVGSTSGIVTGVSGGTTQLYYSTGTGSGCIINKSITVLSSAATITGNPSVCMGYPATFGNSVSPGVWTSGSPGVATINSSTGLLSPVSMGTTIITYTPGTGCASATQTINVVSSLPSIVGSSSVCVGQRDTLSNSTVGGYWSSSSTGIATVDSVTGMVIGASSGNVVITYTASTCNTTIPITVNPLPLPISGPSYLAIGATAILTDATSGGVWSSASPGLATVGSGTGLVSTVAAGSALLSYTISTGCASTKSIIVSYQPCAPLITLIAGDPSDPPYYIDGTPATAIDVNPVSGLVTDSVGNIYMSMYGYIRKVTTDGLIYNFAGAGFLSGGFGEGIPASATYLKAIAMAATPSGDLVYTEDPGRRIRKISMSTGLVYTIAGTGTSGFSGDGGPATAAQISSLSHMIDKNGNIYVCDGSQRIRKINAAGIITTIAGTGVAGYSGDGGPATAANIRMGSAAIDQIGNIYFRNGYYLRKIDTFGIITTIAGQGSNDYTANGVPATATYFNSNVGSVACDKNGNVFFTSGNDNNIVMRIDSAGYVWHHAGSDSLYLAGFTSGHPFGFGDNGVPLQAAMWQITVLYVDNNGDLLFKDTNMGETAIRKVTQGFPSITGTSALCVGSTITLSNSSSGGTWSSNNASVATVGSSSGVVSGVSSGTATITYATPAGCFVVKQITVNALPASISGSASLCIGATSTLSNATTGGTWTSSAVSLATVGSGTGIVTGIATGAATITYTLATGCAATIAVTVGGSTSSITGTASACTGATTTLSNATTGGTWTSSGTGIATVGSGTGVVNGVSAGTATITYTLGSGCTATRVVTINAAPAAITGTASACAGATTTLSDATTGGTWSSSATGVATVGSGTGVVTGVSAGTATITYTLGTGCYATSVVTINAQPAAITGTTSIFLADTSTLSDASTGGSWTSSNTGVATVGSSTGIVTGISGGSATITYTLPTGCYATTLVSVTGVPAPISGSAVICQGATTTFSSPSAGGVWTSSNTGVATIGSSTGVATGVAGGTATMTYTISGSFTTRFVTVIPTPAAITGSSSLCSGSTITLSDASTGGTWSSSSPTVASAGSTGIITGVSAGTATISYSNSCGSAATKAITINPTPAVGAISGASGMCVGGTTTYSDTTAGGVWSIFSSVATIGSATGTVTGTAISGGIVSYTVTNAFGCVGTATKYIYVEGTTGSINTFSGNGANTTTGDGAAAYLATMQGPRDLITDNAGNVYFADINAHMIRKISTEGLITRVAGTGTAGNTGDGGQATAATLNAPNGMYVDNTGDLYIANTNSHTIRKVNAATGIITTIAGTAGTGGNTGDGGPATASKLSSPLGLTGDGAGNLYICDQGNYKIRKINTTTGIISTVAGTGSNSYSGDGGQGTAARLSTPRGVAIDKSGNLYIADALNYVIRKLNTNTGIITTVAGNGTAGSGGDGGQATAAQMSAPSRVAYDGGSLLYITDMTNNKVRQVNIKTGIISTAAGTGTLGFSGDGGAATAAKLSSPCGVACDKLGNMYTTDASNRRIRVVATKGSISINIAGSTTVSPGTTVNFTAYASTTVGVTYQWQKNGSNVGTGLTTYSNSSPANGDVYRCILTITPACGSAYNDTSNSITVLVSSSRQSDGTVTGVAAPTETMANLYPNPVHTSFTIIATGLEDGKADINVYDQLGKVVATQNAEVTNGRIQQMVDMQSLAPGIYVVSVTDVTGNIVRMKCVKD